MLCCFCAPLRQQTNYYPAHETLVAVCDVSCKLQCQHATLTNSTLNSNQITSLKQVDCLIASLLCAKQNAVQMDSFAGNVHWPNSGVYLLR